MKIFVIAVALATFSSVGFAQQPVLAAAPELFVGDVQTFEVTNAGMFSESWTISREVTNKAPDGYRVRSLTDRGGVMTTTNEEYSLDLNLKMVGGGVSSDNGRLKWPMYVGEKWTSTERWINIEGQEGETTFDYTVVGEESVTVPAGTFKALHIHGAGWWKNHTAGGANRAVRDTWFSTEVKGLVRSTFVAWRASGGAMTSNLDLRLVWARLMKDGRFVDIGNANIAQQ
jgi:hypothetical protein